MNNKANATATIAIILALVAIGTCIATYALLQNAMQETNDQMQNVEATTTNKLATQESIITSQTSQIEELNTDLNSLGINCEWITHESDVSGDELCDDYGGQKCALTRSPRTHTYYDSSDLSCSGEVRIHFSEEITYDCAESVYEEDKAIFQQYEIVENGRKTARCVTGGRFGSDHKWAQRNTQTLCCGVQTP